MRKLKYGVCQNTFNDFSGDEKVEDNK